MLAADADADTDEEVAIAEVEAGWRCVLALALEMDMSDVAAAEAEAQAEKVGVRAPGGVGDGWDRMCVSEAAGGTRHRTEGSPTRTTCSWRRRER